MEALLTTVGFNVLSVADGYDAIKVYEQEFMQGRYLQAVFLDLTIPNGLGGRETIKRLLEIDPNVRGIVMSGYSEDEVLSDYESYGFKSRLQKPCTWEELINALGDLPNVSV